MNIIDYFKSNPENLPELWNTDLSCYPISGINLVEDIKLHPKDKILDVGCGYNEFKSYFPQIEGVDLANENADWVGDILDYSASNNSYDIILALGSINFISKQLVYEQMSWISSKLKPNGVIYMRVNPSFSPSSQIKDQFYSWTLEDIYQVALDNNLSIVDDSIKIEHRIPSEYIRKGNDDKLSNVRLFWKYKK
jgi:cyclopropane fatty-acyl-phospholipid synthase-like methyltransferase